MEGHDSPYREVPLTPISQFIDPYRLLVEAVKDYAIYLLDPDGYVATWNAGAQYIKGYSADEIIGRHFSCFYPPEEAARNVPQQHLEQAVALGKVEDKGWRVKKDGTRYWANGLITPLFDDNGALVGFSKVLRDLSEHHAQEQKMQEQQLILAGIIDTAMDGIITIDDTYRIIVFNRAAEIMFRCSAAEVLGQPLDIFIPERFRASHAQLIQTFAQSEISSRKMSNPRIIYGLRATGEEFPLEATISQAEVGRRKQFTVIHRDITERLKAEQLVQERYTLQNQLEAISTTAPCVLCTFRQSPDGAVCFTYASPKIFEIYGLEPEVLAIDASPIFELIHPDDLEQVRITFRESTRTMTTWGLEFRVQNPHKGEIWVEAKSTPVREPDGSILWHGFLMDVTERKQIENSLLASEERFSLVIDATNEGVWDWNIATGEVYFSPNWIKSLGYEPDEVPPNIQFWESCLHPDDVAQVQLKLQEHFAGHTQAYEAVTRLCKKSGDYRWNLDRGKVVTFDESGKPLRMVGTDQDISERKQAEDALRESQRYLKQLIESLPQLVWTCTVDGVCDYLSPQIVKYTGVPQSDQLGFGWLEAVHPDDRERNAHQWMQSVDQQTSFEGEYRIRRVDGEYRWFKSQAQPLKNEQGEVVRWFGSSTDIDDQKRTELALREERNRFNRIAAIVPGAICAFQQWPDGRSRFPYTSMGLVDLYGVLPEDVVEDSSEILNRVHPDDIGHVQKTIQESAQTLTIWRDEYRYLHPIKGEIWVEGHSMPAVEPDGCIQWYGIVIDISKRKQAEIALREHQRYLQELIESLPQIVWTMDAQGKTTYISPQWYEYTGLQPVTPLPLNWGQVVHPEDSIRNTDLLQRVLSEERMFDAEYRIQRADGVYRWFKVRAVPFRDQSGKIVRWIGTSTDIDDQKQTEVALRQWADAFENCAHGIAIGDPVTNCVIACNPAFASLHHQSAEGIVGQPLLSLYDPADWDYIKACIASADQIGQIRYETRMQRKDGSQFNVQMDVVSVRDESGRVRYRVATMQDITDRKQAEEIIRESEARYRNLVEVSPDAIFINRDRQIVFVNRQGLKLFGAQTSDQLLGKSPYDLFHPDYHELIRHRIQTMLATKKSSRAIEEKIVRLDGQVVDVEVTASSFLDQEKQAIHVVLRDITERKQAERRLRTQGMVSRILAEANTFSEIALDIIQTLCEAEAWDYGVIWKVDKKANQLECVDVWARPELGLEALVAQTRSLTFAPNVCLPGRVWVEGKAAGDEDVVGEHHTCPRAPFAIKSGLCSVIAFPIVHRGETLGVMDFMNRTRIVFDQPLQAQLGIVGSQVGQFLARKQAQEEVHRFVAGSPAVIFALKREGAGWKPAWTSENVFQLTGYHADEANEPGWWASHLHPEDHDRILATESTLETTNHLIVEYRFGRRDGTYFWVRDEKRILFDSHDQPTEIVGSWSDITERVRLEEQLRQSQKMEAVGQLAGGIAHDFNNLLTVIVGYSDLLLARMPPADPKRTNVADIKHAGEQAAALTRQLLAFSRKQILDPKIIDLNETVSRIEKMLRRLIGEDIILTTILPPSVSKVKVDPGQLEQVIINLAVNARDAMPQGGHLTIETGMTELDDKYCHSRPECTPGWYTQVSLSDTGCGMSPEVRNHIFEPFFTTKEPGKGTGLGLATVFGIVKQSGGHIEVYSEVGVGTSFKIYLPAIEEKWTVMQTETPTEDAQPGNEIILLVEDEAIVRTITRLSLETFGYQVIEAGSGAEALELAKTLTEPISLLVTDVIMPKMNGRQLATQFQQQFPNLKVLLMSGYTDDAIIRHGVIDDTYAFIQKPFTPNLLAKKVREVLEEKRVRGEIVKS